MSKRKTVAEIRAEAAHKARIAAIHECVRVMRYLLDEDVLAEKLFTVMRKDDYARNKHRESAAGARFMNTTPDDYFGTN